MVMVAVGAEAPSYRDLAADLSALRRNVKRIEKDVDDMVLHDAGIDVGPKRADGAGGLGSSADSGPRAMHRAAPVAPCAPHRAEEQESARALGLLSAPDLESLRAASLNHAFLPGPGSAQPQRATPRAAEPSRRKLTKQRPHGRIGFGSGLPL